MAMIDHSILDDENISVIENEYIRLGINLGLGGAVTYLAELGHDNLINSSDWGRQVQMSFYSGPNPFTPRGKQPRPEWRGLGWNPIQSGDVAGNRSRILEHTNDGGEIYVKCVPMQWPLDNEPGECTFETRYRLDGRSVIVESRLNNARSDKTQYHGRHQELPAVYTNGVWYKLVSYIGSKPYSGDDLTVLIDRYDGKGWPWISYIPTESWAALVDDDNYGLGVYNQSTNMFIGGFAGEKGAGGPKDSPCGYISPLHTEILDYNIIYDYSYRLIVGTVDEIRDKVYSVSTKSAQTHFDFTHNRDHWSYSNIVDKGYQSQDCLDFDFTDPNASINSPFCYWTNGQFNRVIIDAAIDLAQDSQPPVQPFTLTANLYDGLGHENEHTTKSEPISFTPVCDGRRRLYTIDIDKAVLRGRGVFGFSIGLGQNRGAAKIYSVTIE